MYFSNAFAKAVAKPPIILRTPMIIRKALVPF